MAKAFVFPGQGSQFVGMGKSLYEENEQARQLFEQANEILGFRITDLMFNGTPEDLVQTKVTQPAVFLCSVIPAIVRGIEPDMVAGHSLGEFSALVASGALSFEDGLKLVSKRAQAMQKCCEKVPGTMAESRAFIRKMSTIDISSTITTSYSSGEDRSFPNTVPAISGPPSTSSSLWMVFAS